jgi:hypothetical protein
LDQSRRTIFVASFVLSFVDKGSQTSEASAPADAVGSSRRLAASSSFSFSNYCIEDEDDDEDEEEPSCRRP